MAMSNRWSSAWKLTAGLALATIIGVLSRGMLARLHSAETKGYLVPRTGDGHPDLQGYWTTLTYTPFERPKELADKPFYTEQEAMDAFQKAVQQRAANEQIAHFVRSDFGLTPVQTGAKPNLRTSLVIDPPDGRLPRLTPEAVQRVAARRSAQIPNTSAETWRDDRGTIRCVFEDGVVPFIPDVYGSNYDIVQTRDWILIVYEFNTEHRVIPLDGRPPGPASVRTYAGDSRGRWVGDTLVVETTNFSPKKNLRGSEGTFTLVERFTRISDDTIDYRFTIEDPTTWVRPWTAAVPMSHTKGPLLEYACNENNQDVFKALKNARAQEQGKLAPAAVMRLGDPKAEITHYEETGKSTVLGVDENDDPK
jgi:hypothetical protein